MKKLNSSLLLPILACVALASRVSASIVASGAGLEAKVDAIVAEFLSKPGGVGLSIGVAQKGQVLLEKAYGLADAEFDVPADAQTMFRIGSVTKQFTAATIMRFVERGKIHLDDELSQFVPEFPLQGHKVTIRHLLTHTSGIKSYTDVGDEWEKKWPLELTHAELLALVKDAPFDFEPGADWRYDNTGYYLLGMVLEKISGQSYGEVLKTELFTPLRLERTRYDSNSDLIKNRAQGYALTNGALTNDKPLGMAQPGAAGGLISTGGDLVRWQMALTSGQVVKPESFAQMTAPTMLPNGKNTHYGFGLMLGDAPGRKRIQHGGGIFGFNSMLMWLPDEDLHVAVISNGEPVPSSRVADAIAYAALGIEKPLVKDDPIPADLIAKIAGNYVIADIRLVVRVFGERVHLMVQATGQEPFRVMWQGGYEFRAVFDNEVRFVFAADGKSLDLYQGGGQFAGVRKD